MPDMLARQRQAKARLYGLHLPEKRANPGDLEMPGVRLGEVLPLKARTASASPSCHKSRFSFQKKTDTKRNGGLERRWQKSARIAVRSTIIKPEDCVIRVLG